jgi:hypothetical protein
LHSLENSLLATIVRNEKIPPSKLRFCSYSTYIIALSNVKLMERFVYPNPMLYCFYVFPSIFIWQYNVLVSSAEVIIKEYDLKTLMFFNEHFNITLFNGLDEYLNLDPFIKEAYKKLGLDRQKELEQIDYTRRKKEQEIREQAQDTLGNREAFDKLANFSR